MQSHFGLELDFPAHHRQLAKRLHQHGQPVYWESARIEQLIHGYLRDVAEDLHDDRELTDWLRRFDADRHLAARAYWEQLRLGIEQRMSELPEPPA
mgnify:CR=1 FL=1